MDDTIYRQAALDVLRTCYDTEIKQYSDGSEWINYEDAVEGMKTLPPAEPEREGRWIPCSDRLPYLYLHVLVTNKYDDVMVAYRAADRWCVIYGTSLPLEDVIAWMPLPDKGDEE